MAVRCPVIVWFTDYYIVSLCIHISWIVQ